MADYNLFVEKMMKREVHINKETEGFTEIISIIDFIKDKIYRVYDDNTVKFCLECLDNFKTLDDYREYVKNEQNPVVRKLAIVRMAMDEFGR